ncbi:MAG: hypothetical protein J5J06_15210 [Phycisphaerae bacterium]|nr:hypothetical protein [Phycisphaerae bacterium]
MTAWSDSEARLARKGNGQPALLSHSVHVLIDTDARLCLDVAVDQANGRAERAGAGDDPPAEV